MTERHLMLLEFTVCMSLAMQSCCATHISVDRLLNRRLKNVSSGRVSCSQFFTIVKESIRRDRAVNMAGKDVLFTMVREVAAHQAATMAS